jgi:hypothetical protein
MFNKRLLVLGLVLLIVLLVTAGCGLFKEDPVVGILANPINGKAPLLVNFTAEVLKNDAQIIRYEWAFGDGEFGDGEFVSHTYTASGSYTVRLRVFDQDGRVSKWAEQTIEVQPAPKPPTCDGINIWNETGPSACPPFCVGDLLWFNPINPSDPESGTLTYSWNFGDGRGEAGYTVDHVYCRPGRYTVTLTIKSNKGTSKSFSRNITIQECCSCLPEFVIDPAGHTICCGKSITLCAKFLDPCNGCCQVDTKEIVLDAELEAKCCPPPDCYETGCYYNGYFEWVVDLNGTRLANHIRGSCVTITPPQTGSMTVRLYYTCGSKSHSVKETYTVKCCGCDCCSSGE